MKATTLDVLKRILDMDETISQENAEKILFACTHAEPHGFDAFLNAIALYAAMMVPAAAPPASTVFHGTARTILRAVGTRGRVR